MTPDLLVTGTPRSGTSLLDKLLSAHPAIAVLSQPLPRLYIAVKRAFLQDPSALEQTFPLNDLFDAAYRPPADFTAHLARAAYPPDWLARQLAEMLGHPAQLVRPVAAPDALVPGRPVSFPAFVAHYLAAHAPGGARWIGAKEIVAEEFIGTFLKAGTRVIQVLRDPRDVVASVFGPRGADYAGPRLPLLFVLRQWRKSVAFALHHAGHPGFRALRYEDLVTDPDAALAPLAGWLGAAPFPPALAERPLMEVGGAVWAANSSHGPLDGVSAARIGIGERMLSPDILGEIETLCAPEMRCLGYGPTGATGGLDRDPCPDPRPVLAGYCWGPGALRPERRRLDALHAGRFEPSLHLLPRAFDALTRATPLPCAGTAS